jgi:hypothetical protein
MNSVMAWSTRDVMQSEAASCWVKMLAEAMPRLQALPLDGQFEASLQRRSVRGPGFNKISARPQRVVRTFGHGRRPSSADFDLVYVASVLVRIEHQTRIGDLAPGACALIDTCEVFSALTCKASNTLSITLPAACVRQWVTTPDARHRAGFQTWGPAPGHAGAVDG